MFILKQAKINKYKSYSAQQEVLLESDVTTLVGKNESGKTAFLEALAKLNYFTNDEDFEFDTVQDYPRNELKKYQRSGEDLEPIVCTFQLDQNTIDEINTDLGEGVLTTDTFSVSSRYGSGRIWYHINSNEKQYLENLQLPLGFNDKTKEKVLELGTVKKISEADFGEDTELQSVIEHIKSTIVSEGFDWDRVLVDAYITKKYISPRLPRFWYFDEYHELPSRVSIDAIRNNAITGELTKQQLETAKALFELAMIDVEELANSTNFESFIAELEATSNDITDKIFDYWSTNSNLSIEFKIDQVDRPNNQAPEKILDIRVKNHRHRITLPLKNRSKGFNWFFSFIVWFSKIQDEKGKNFILLLDEPGLNLHASAQADLLRFINDLSSDYQIVYSTHSPFMVESDKLHRVRTVYDSDAGSIISDAIQEKDPDTLFPLQAALGYDIAQNLFVSKNNLLVEGPSDLNYLTFMSNLLESEGRECLRDDVTIVPVGGLDKVVSFISLLRGSKLKISCLLDSFNNTKGAQRLDSLIQSKIIKDKHVRFFDEFAGDNYEKADIEDLFEKSEYLHILGEALPEYNGIAVSELDDKKQTILLQLKSVLGGKDFNHYKPSQSLLGMGLTAKYFSKDTFDRFEKMFIEINKLY
ncbi:AAA family ATPase [Marinobacter psychrophilus]|uniref:AAA family ATPase n=1 Tax=Marinobacter psychrophilus TaxID=330734 RepID=UPI001B6778F8|nr:AAA family ATPase [Marinobacter psychrophilus]MBQ0761854.1 AAA family ATPase [Marinobacter psychrophilus]MBQ0845260.1 AAA family ATPase [Marinobacter psychrophilus]